MKFLIREPIIIFFIVLNTIAIFLSSFEDYHNAFGRILFGIDYLCTFYFVIEASIKIREHGFRSYWNVSWNRFDFIVIILSSPSLLEPFIDLQASGLSAILLLRLGRIARFFRLLHFVPNGEKMWIGVVRALRASVGILLTVFMVYFVIAMGATILFGRLMPEYFNNPMNALYSVFQLTVMYDFPDTSALADPAHNIDRWTVQGYLILTFIIGGLVAISIADSIFVGEMLEESSENTEEQIEELAKLVASQKEEMVGLRTDLRELKDMIRNNRQT